MVKRSPSAGSSRQPGGPRVGAFLPPVALAPTDGGAPLELGRRSRLSTLRVLVHDPACAPCVACLELEPVERLESELAAIATQCPECGVPDEPGHGEWS